ncbi:MAG: FkbM family methyltransferase [Chloroflexota bacterium]|jgi:FkbM family methyltransferase
MFDSFFALKRPLVHLRRMLFERLGSDRYSWLALNALDRKLLPYLSYRGGFFVELGANDGLSQSNTYYFERWLGWRGILIEPVPELYRRAARARPKARVFNCACVPFDYPNPDIQIAFAGLMSVVKGSWADPAQERKHVAIGRELERINGPLELRVPARTLTSILDECQASRIDLLSLDVEGYEAEVLAGLDFERYQPRYMLIEVRDPARVEALVLPCYERVEQMSELDVLYRLRENISAGM